MRLLLASVVLLVSCADSFPVPAGALIACNSNDECPTGQQCDTAIPSTLARGRCVSEIVAPPAFTLSADPPLGPRRQVFTFTAAGASTETFRWELYVGSSPTPRVAAETGAVLRQSFEALGRAEFCDAVECRDAIPVRVRAVATNAVGKSTADVATVVVVNHAPVADFGDDLFISEQGVPEVELGVCGGLDGDAGCTTFDPDDDPLRFEGFRQVSGPDAGVTITDGRVTFRPPRGAHRPLVFEGTVDDGIRRSTARVQVNRGSFGWTKVGQLGETYRLHPDFRAAAKWLAPSGISEPFYGVDAIAADGRGGWWFADSYPDGSGPTGRPRTLLVHLDANLRELPGERVTVADLGGESSVRGFVPPSATRSGCVGFTPTDWKPDGGVPRPSPGFARVSPGQPLGTVHSFFAPDGAVHAPLGVASAGPGGNCWTIRNAAGVNGFNALGGFVSQLTPNDTFTGEVATAGLPTAFVAEADGTLWLAERFPIPGDAGFLPPVQNSYRSELRRYAPGGGVTRIEVGDRFLTMLALHPAGGVWAMDARALRLVRILADGTVRDSSGATLGSASIFETQGLAVDPVSGAIWVIDALGNRLVQLEETGDAGLREVTSAGPDDLPEGVNRKSWAGSLAIDPVTGSVSTFVGAVSSIYAYWVTVPSHSRRVERAPVLQPMNPVLRGDPTSGALWLSGPGEVRKVDVKGRTLAWAPNVFGDSFPLSAPLVVDRSGQAWVVSTPGGTPLLRALDRHGRDVRALPLPFAPTNLALARGYEEQTGALREVLCATNPKAGALRVELATGVVTVLQRPTRSDGGVDDTTTCAPTSSGQVWVFANEPSEHSVWKFGAGSGALQASWVIEPQPVQLMGVAADELRDRVYYGTWHFPGYEAELRQLDGAGVRSDVRVLQGAVSGEVRVGIPLNVFIRPVCPGPEAACTELWVSNRVSEVHRFGLTGDDLETFVFGRQEGPLDLVP